MFALGTVRKLTWEYFCIMAH